MESCEGGVKGTWAASHLISPQASMRRTQATTRRDKRGAAGRGVHIPAFSHAYHTAGMRVLDVANPAQLAIVLQASEAQKLLAAAAACERDM